MESSITEVWSTKYYKWLQAFFVLECDYCSFDLFYFFRGFIRRSNRVKRISALDGTTKIKFWQQSKDSCFALTTYLQGASVFSQLAAQANEKPNEKKNYNLKTSCYIVDRFASGSNSLIVERIFLSLLFVANGWQCDDHCHFRSDFCFCRTIFPYEWIKRSSPKWYSVCMLPNHFFRKFFFGIIIIIIVNKLLLMEDTWPDVHLF